MQFVCSKFYSSFSLFSAAAVTGYQQPSESASGHTSPFYVALLDSNNKEQRLDEKGETNFTLKSDIWWISCPNILIDLTLIECLQ